jgi:eukaryotic-like serine/threonine-protein kinase
MNETRRSGTISCALCREDITELANSDGRAEELGDEVIYWCSQCSWKQFTFQSYPINLLGYVEYTGLGGRWAYTALGHHHSTGRVAAIKKIRFWQNKEENRLRFLADLKRLARIDHPRCTRIIEAGSGLSSIDVASVYVQGPNLQQWVEGRHGRYIAPHEAAGAVLGLLDGLERMHKLGFAHANLHPGNILLHDGELSRPKLCMADFSPAYMLDSYDPESDLPAGSELAMLFLVRELVVGSSRQELAWDLYSLGQALYYLLTGKTSFDYSTEAGNGGSDRLIEMILHPEPISIQERLPPISPRLAGVVDRAVGKNPDKRFQCVEEFKAALKQVEKEL